MKKKVQPEDIGMCFSAFMLLVMIAFAMKGAAQGQEDAMSEIAWNILVSAVTALVTAAGSYFILLKKMPDRIADELLKNLDAKMNPSNSELRADQRLLQTTMQGEHSKLSEEHEKLRSYLEEAAKKQAAMEVQYGQLDSSGKDIVDAVKKLDSFAVSFQLMNGRLVELELQVMSLQQENRRLQQQAREFRQSKTEQEFEY